MTNSMNKRKKYLRHNDENVYVGSGPQLQVQLAFSLIDIRNQIEKKNDRLRKEGPAFDKRTERKILLEAIFGDSSFPFLDDLLHDDMSNSLHYALK